MTRCGLATLSVWVRSRGVNVKSLARSVGQPAVSRNRPTSSQPRGFGSLLAVPRCDDVGLDSVVGRVCRVARRDCGAAAQTQRDEAIFAHDSPCARLPLASHLHPRRTCQSPSQSCPRQCPGLQRLMSSAYVRGTCPQRALSRLTYGALLLHGLVAVRPRAVVHGRQRAVGRVAALERKLRGMRRRRASSN